MSKSKLLDTQKELIALSEKHDLISPLVHVGQFQSDCELLLNEEEMDPTKRKAMTPQNISVEMEIDKEIAEELEQVCSPSNLYCSREAEIKNWDLADSIPNNSGLATLQHWKNAEKKRKVDRKYIKCRYSEMDCALIDQLEQIKPKDVNDQVKYPNVVLTVRVNFPDRIRAQTNAGTDFLVLGTQKLSELRDRITCSLDHQPVGNFTDNPDHPRDIKLKDICPSSFFLIENTLFVDGRPPCVDLSTDIIKWSKEYDTPLPENLQQSKMESFTFNNLKLRLGHPYYFYHQGMCEHIMVFKDIRLLNASDCQSVSAYPVTISRSKFKTFPCRVCNFLVSTWMTRNDSLAPEDPCFFCDSCFRQLHYDKDGNKVGDFIAFPHISLVSFDC